MADWAAAVLATGYAGPWTSELYSPRHWELGGTRLATECLVRMSELLARAQFRPAVVRGTETG